MESILLEHISHSYGEIPVLNDISLEISRGELFTLLGPSGCGKTTLLRIIAGFLAPSRGKILIDGRDVTGLPSEKRGMGVVFQNYALFPNMTVEENIAYGLKIRNTPKAGIRERCEHFLKLTNLTAERGRSTEQLSGGQQQRVAIARALIVNPEMLLLDEPLSNLDVGLRVKMREEIREIQQSTGVTTLFITHDQQEALSISHRIAVMNNGVIEQLGTPHEIYDRPMSSFVADFVGKYNRVCPADAAALGSDGSCPFLRPERLALSKNEGEGLPVMVECVRFDGPCYSYSVRGENATYSVTALNDGEGVLSVGERAYLRIRKV